MEYIQAAYDSIDQLIEMRVAYLREDFGEISDEEIEAIKRELPKYFANHLGRDMVAFVAKEQGRMVAAAMLVIIEKPANPLFITGKIGEVLNVYTCPKYRRRGIAKQLLRMLLQYAKERKLDFVELKASIAGLALYKQSGFKEKKTSYISMKYDI